MTCVPSPTLFGLPLPPDSSARLHSFPNRAGCSQSAIADEYHPTVIGSATKMKKPVRHFDENPTTPQLEASASATQNENLHPAHLSVLILRGGFLIFMADDGGSAIKMRKRLGRLDIIWTRIRYRLPQRWV